MSTRMADQQINICTHALNREDRRTRKCGMKGPVRSQEQVLCNRRYDQIARTAIANCIQSGTTRENASAKKKLGGNSCLGGGIVNFDLVAPGELIKFSCLSAENGVWGGGRGIAVRETETEGSCSITSVARSGNREIGTN